MFSPNLPQPVRCPQCYNLAAVTVCYFCGHEFLPLAEKRGSPDLFPEGRALSLQPEQFVNSVGQNLADVAP